MSSPDQSDTDLELQLLPSEEADVEIDNAPYDIRTLGADFSLELYSQKISSGEIVIPPFQRRYVWPIKKASKLIESFLLSLPVPQVFLFQESSRRDLLVVDGQQRLITTHLFFGGKFQNEVPSFALRGVKPKWEGKTFNDLDEGDKRRLKNYILRATIFEQINPADNKSVYEIFERLNSGGMPLNEQEVRNSVVHGEINDFLDQLNNESSWRDLLGKQEPDRRMKDVEMILRVLSLIDGWQGYKKPMKDFITAFMSKNVNIGTTDRTRWHSLFKNVSEMILREAGTTAFRLSGGRVNVPVIDSVMVAVAIIGPQNITDFKTKLETLKKNPSYSNYVSEATTDDDAVKGRIKMALQAFKHE